MIEEIKKLEKEKLILEIKNLKRAYHKKPTFWLGITSVFIALVGVIGQGYLSSIKSENSKVELRQVKNQIQEFEKKRNDLIAACSSLQTKNEYVC